MYEVNDVNDKNEYVHVLMEFIIHTLKYVRERHMEVISIDVLR